MADVIDFSKLSSSQQRALMQLVNERASQLESGQVETDYSGLETHYVCHGKPAHAFTESQLREFNRARAADKADFCPECNKRLGAAPVAYNGQVVPIEHQVALRHGDGATLAQYAVATASDDGSEN